MYFKSITYVTSSYVYCIYTMIYETNLFTVFIENYSLFNEKSIQKARRIIISLQLVV